jgi:hypothetical protein
VNETKIRQIRAQFGYRLFAKAEFTPSLQHLLHAREPVRRVLSLFPQLLPSGERSASAFPIQMPVMIDSMLPLAVRALIPYLIAQRRRLRCHTQQPDMAPEEEDALSPEDVISAVDMATASVLPEHTRAGQARMSSVSDVDGSDAGGVVEGGDAQAAVTFIDDADIGYADKTTTGASGRGLARAPVPAGSSRRGSLVSTAPHSYTAVSPASESAALEASTAAGKRPLSPLHVVPAGHDVLPAAEPTQMPPAALVDTVLLTAFLWLEGYYAAVSSVEATAPGPSSSAEGAPGRQAAQAHAQLRRVRSAVLRLLSEPNCVNTAEAELQLKSFGRQEGMELVFLYRSKGMHAEVVRLLQDRVAAAASVTSPGELDDVGCLLPHLRASWVPDRSRTALLTHVEEPTEASVAAAAMVQRLLLLCDYLRDLPLGNHAQLATGIVTWLMSGAAGTVGVLLGLRLLMIMTTPAVACPFADAEHARGACIALQDGLNVLRGLRAVVAPPLLWRLTYQASEVDSADVGVGTSQAHCHSLGATADLDTWVTPLLAPPSGFAADEPSGAPALTPASAVTILQAALLQHSEEGHRQHAADCTTCQRATHLDGSSSLALRAASDRSVLVRNTLVRALLDLILQLHGKEASDMLLSNLGSPLGHVPIERAPGLLGHFRRRLLRVLRGPGGLDAAWALRHLPQEGFLEERAELLRRLGQHDAALRIIVQRMGDYAAAMRYCERALEEATQLAAAEPAAAPATADGSTSGTATSPIVASEQGRRRVSAVFTALLRATLAAPPAAREAVGKAAAPRRVAAIADAVGAGETQSLPLVAGGASSSSAVHAGLARLLTALGQHPTVFPAVVAAEPSPPNGAAVPVAASGSSITDHATEDHPIQRVLPFLLRHFQHVDMSSALAELPTDVPLSTVLPLLTSALSHETAMARTARVAAGLGRASHLHASVLSHQVPAAMVTTVDRKTLCTSCGEVLATRTPAGRQLGPFVRGTDGSLIHLACFGKPRRQVSARAPADPTRDEAPAGRPVRASIMETPAEGGEPGRVPAPEHQASVMSMRPVAGRSRQVPNSLTEA